MALINKIREKSGIAVTVIAVSLILFIVGGDLLGPGSFFGGNNQIVGEIGGKDINIKQFQQQMDLLRQNYEAQTGRAPGEQELASLRDQAWNQLIVEYAYTGQYDKLGLEVTDDELVDMVQGNHISPAIQQAFTNPQTGVFDKAAVINYLKSLKTMAPEQQQSWSLFETGLRADRLRQKYELLLSSSNYATKAEAEKEYIAQNSKATFDYLYVPFYSVPDSTVKVTDSQLESYLKSHKDEYKGVNTRSIKYVTFPVQPAKDDSASLYNEIKSLARGLSTATNDSAFAKMNSDVQFPLYQSYANMTDQLKEAVKTFVPGGVFGPFREGDTYFIYKYGGTKRDSLFTLRASHILIRPDNQSDSAKAVAKQRAEGLLRQIQGGASFEALAASNSADGSAQRGGDLGYFQNNGGMVKPFEDAAFSVSGTGLVGHIVESQFGFHIIKVTDAKSNILYRIATIGKTIAPSQATRDEIYRKADLFATTAKSSALFDEQVKKDKLIEATANRLTETSSNVNAMQDAREIVRWAFSDKTDVNDVSKVFETANQYVVAVLTGKTDKDQVKVNDFREELTAKVRNQVKSEQILAKLKGIEGANLQAVAGKYGAGALVEKAENVSLATGFLTSAGFDPIAMGRAFGLKKGQKTNPFKGENGVFIIQLADKTEAAPIADYAQYKSQLTQNVTQSTSFILNEAIREHAKIVDDRAKFF